MLYNYILILSFDLKMNHKLKLTFLYFFIFFSVGIHAQQCTLFSLNNEKAGYDSVYYGNSFNQYLDSITASGYYTLKITAKKTNPCEIYFDKGSYLERIYLSKIPIKNSLIQYDSIQKLYYTDDLDGYIQLVKDSLENAGNPFSEIIVEPMGWRNATAMAQIKLKADTARHINDIKFIGYDRIPKFVEKDILRKNLLYTSENSAFIEQKINTYSFLNQTEAPRVSFTKDSTTLYIYVTKRKQSIFDGLIGFESDEEGKFNLQGNVNIALINAFNGFEKINLQWESGLNKSQQLDFGAHIPYIFNSPLGIAAKLNIHKQDSSFVRLNMSNSIVYQFSPTHYLGGNFNLAGSNFINGTTAGQQDYTKNGFGITYYYQTGIDRVFRENKTFIEVNSGLWKRKFNDESLGTTSQTDIIYMVRRQQALWKDHYVYAALSGSNLIQEGVYLENDMYLMGGFNSLRGFNQNSIITPSFNMLTLSYRYIPSNQILFELFSDLALVKSIDNQTSETLNSIGLGMQFFTRFGIFQMNYALGKTANTGFDFTNGKIHIGVMSFF